MKKEYKSIEKIAKKLTFFCKNKPNFRPFRPKNGDFTKKQTQLKPNSNPIKANSKPITSKSKMNAYARKSGHTMKYCYFLAKIYHPIRVPISRVANPIKANTNPIQIYPRML
jgi:hypothetical protein